jgi:arylsulfatase A-like enzyme
MALGPGIRQRVIVNRPVDSLDLVPTLGARLGFSTPLVAGKPLAEVLG